MTTTLTPREREIAGMVAKGLTNQGIASRLGVSPKTVDAHVQNAAHRLGGETSPRHRLTVWFFEAIAKERRSA